MMPTNRRTFLGAAGVLALSGRLASAAPSERVRVAVIGVRGRGADLARNFAGTEDAEVVALCDIDDEAFAKPVKAVEKIAGKAPRTEKDFRRLLDDKAIDAIAVATPDHWHALIAVMGCQAGKDVYVEKPVSHNLVEGRRMVEAARKYGRVVQAGTQRRSMTHVQRRRRPRPLRRARQRGVGPRLDPPGTRRRSARASPSRSPRASTTPCGRGPPPTGRSSRTASTTTGTGSGTGAPASWATTASTASTSPAGASASTPRSPSAPAAASTSSTTTRKTPTPRS